MRRGFSLVECIIAMLLLSVGVLGLAGAGVSAMRDLGRADRSYLAAAHGSALLDSLSLVEHPVAGTSSRDGLRIDWQVSPMPTGTRVDLTARHMGSVLFDASTFAAPWPPRIGRIP